MRTAEVKQLLDDAYQEFNTPDFISSDPISIPHLFSKQQDIEIMGLWAALLAWGQRTTILNKCHELISLMDGAPHDFMINHHEKDLKRFLSFKHRTFNTTDTLYFIRFLSSYYKDHFSLEEAFSNSISASETSVEKGLIQFHELFFSLEDAPERTRKHVATPVRKSACKRLNMFLRWMVRKDVIDFGLWKSIDKSQLVCPLDVHVERVARKLGLLHRKQTDWLAARELTENLKKFSPEDPVKYDISLFGLGVSGKPF